MSKNRKPHLVVIVNYTKKDLSKTYTKDLYTVSDANRASKAFVDDHEREMLFYNTVWGSSLTLEDMDEVHPKDRIEQVKNMVLLLNEHNLNIIYYTNSMTALRTLDNCILSFKLKGNYNYPKLNPKYLEAYKMVNGEKENIKIDKENEPYGGSINYDFLRDYETSLLNDCMSLVIKILEGEYEETLTPCCVCNKNMVVATGLGIPCQECQDKDLNWVDKV